MFVEYRLTFMIPGSLSIRLFGGGGGGGWGRRGREEGEKGRKA